MPLLLFLLLPWIIMTAVQAADLPIPPPPAKTPPDTKQAAQPAKQKVHQIGKPIDKGRLE